MKISLSLIILIWSCNVGAYASVEVNIEHDGISIITVDGPVNVALNKPTQQSSVHNGGFPKKAVDGDTNAVYGDGSCTHTTDGNHDLLPAWWTVDLQNTYNVDQIMIYNRGDYNSKLLDKLNYV